MRELFVHYLALLGNAFLVNEFEKVAHKTLAHAAERALRTTLVEDFGIARGLDDGHIVLLLVGADFAADAHALVENFEQAVIAFIDLLAQALQTFGRFAHLADGKFVENEVEHFGCDLLSRITPSGIGGAVTLHDETVEAQIHGLLAERGDEFSTTTDVGRIAEDGEVGDATTELDGDVPHGAVAVDALVVA